MKPWPILLASTFLTFGCALEDPACEEGRCDELPGDVTWSYAAGSVPWVTCTADGGKIACALEANAPAEVAATSALIGKGVGAIYSTTLTTAAPTRRLPETFAAGDKLHVVVDAAATEGWGGPIDFKLAAPTASKPARVALPHDLWRVRLTKLAGGTDAKVELLIHNKVKLTGATYLAGDVAERSYFGSIAMAAGDAPEAVQQTYLIPVSAGGKIHGFYDAGLAFGEPQFTIDAPGCYLVNNGTQILPDPDCVETEKRVPTAPPDAGG
jgi:hypothetical protein